MQTTFKKFDLNFWTAGLEKSEWPIYSGGEQGSKFSHIVK